MNKRLLAVLIALLILLSGCVTARERRDTYVNEHPDLSEEVRTAVLEGRICPRMTEDEVRASWGEPQRIVVLYSGEDSYQECWGYQAPIGRFAEGAPLLTFTNGELASLAH